MNQATLPAPACQRVAVLKERLARLAQARRGEQQIVSTGCPELDRSLPHGGLCRGTLVEWLSPGPGSGAGSLALAAARAACGTGGTVVVVDMGDRFYPPAAAQAGLDLDRLLLVHPQNRADENWALEESLRSPGVAAVMCWIERGGPGATRLWRRWQLAAQGGATLGLFVRPATVRGDPSWADVRFLVQPQPADAQRRLRVELLRLRGSAGGRTLDVELDDETGAVRLAPPLAPAALVRHPSRVPGRPDRRRAL